MSWIFSIFENFFGWLSSISAERIVAVFWFLFFIEIPRYYLLDFIILVKIKLNSHKYHKRDIVARFKLRTDSPFVSIIVPGKNEGDNIYKLAKSLKEQTYQNFEFVIIDDGSDDNTPIICRSLSECGLISRYYRADVRGGKASAANMGLMNNRAKFIVHLDADSSLDRNALEEVLLPFYWDQNVKAVGGCVKVRNHDDSICTTLQSLEYLETILVGRTVTSELGLFRTISGAFGAFDSEVLKQVGGWDIGPGLDGDITQKIRKSGYNVVFTRKAVCMTSVPTRFKALYNQRLRWSRSLVRFRLRKHIDVLNVFSKNFNIFNFISNLENIIFNFVLDFVWIFYILTLIINNGADLLEIIMLKMLIMIPLSLVSVISILIFTERRREEFPLVIYAPLQTIYSGYFLRITRIIATLQELFFHKSYQDKWNPEKASVYARITRM